MVDGLDARLKAGTGTPDEWVRLIRSRTVLGERDQAMAALARARTALASDPQGLAHVEAAAGELGLAQAQANPQSQPPTVPTPNPTAKADTEAAMAVVRAMPPAERDAAVRGMVEALDRRLAAKGGNPDEWMRLVRSYSVLGERERAAQILDRARMALSPDPGAIERLDELSRELDLRGQAPKPPAPTGKP